MTTEEVEARVNSESNVLVKLGRAHGLGGNHTNHVNAGRKDGDNLSPFMRQIIAAAANLDSAPSVGKTFGISKAHAHNLKHGYVTRPNGKDNELVARTRKTLDKVHDKAADLVLDCLGLVTPEKLKTIEKVKDLTQVAKDLAAVAEKSAPQEKGNTGNTYQLNIYAPGQMDESLFDVIEVEAKEVN